MNETKTLLAKQTPGPWEAYNVAGAGWSVRGQHEREGYRGLAPICSMAWWQFDIPGIIDDGISEANAKLIAAAPDLLVACIAARKQMTNQRYNKPRIDMEAECAACDAAIAKATGAQP